MAPRASVRGRMKGYLVRQCFRSAVMKSRKTLGFAILFHPGTRKLCGWPYLTWNWLNDLRWPARRSCLFVFWRLSRSILIVTSEAPLFGSADFSPRIPQAPDDALATYFTATSFCRFYHL